MEPDNTGSSTLLSIANKRTRAAKAETVACNDAWYERSLELHEQITNGIIALADAKERYESLSLTHGDTIRELKDATTALANANERVEKAKREERMTWDAAENSHRCRENVEALLTAANERADRWELAATNANRRLKEERGLGFKSLNGMYKELTGLPEMAMPIPDAIRSLRRQLIVAKRSRDGWKDDILRYAQDAEDSQPRLNAANGEIVRLRGLINFGRRLVAAKAFAVEYPVVNELECYRMLAEEAKKWLDTTPAEILSWGKSTEAARKD